MRFCDVIGQPTAVTQLQRAYANARLSHAYIFDGPEGVGKKTTALALAALLLCESPSDADSCGHCRSCRQVAVESHPDLHLIVPDGRTVKIKQIRDLRRRLSGTASYGGYSVIIIDAADTMTLEATNAFLKTIEEPQGPTCFILITTHSDRLPDTIRSRAQLVRFHALSQASLQRLLAAAADTPAGRTAIDLCGGSLSRARLMLEDDALREQQLSRRETLETLLDGLTTSHGGALLRFADTFMGDRDGVRDEVLLIRRYYNDRLHHALGVGTDLSTSLAVLHDTTTALSRLETNTEPAFILGALLIEMARHCRQ